MKPGDSGTVVLLDTNIWRSEPMLMTNRGSALIYHLRANRHRILLPEVVEIETRNVLLSYYDEAIEKIEDGLRAVATVFGRAPEPTLRPSAEVDQRLTERLDELASDGLLLRAPLAVSIAKEAVRRATQRIRPTIGEKEECRDQMVWTTALEFARNGTAVIFVSGDKSYYDGKNLATVNRSIAEESQGIPLEVVRNIEECLTILSPSTPPLDKASIARALGSSLRDSAAGVAGKYGLSVGDPTVDVTAFTTAEPQVLLVEYRATFPTAGESIDLVLSDRTIVVGDDPRVVCEGSARWNTDAASIDGELERDVERIEWTGSDGERVSGPGNQYVRVGTIVLGERSRELSVSHELP